MSSDKRIVVTGMGAVTPIGNTIDEFWDSMMQGTSGSKMMEGEDVSNLATRFACQVKNLNVLDFLDGKSVNRMDRCSHYGVISAEQALKDAKLRSNDVDPKRIGVIYGSGIGGISTFCTQHLKFSEGGASRVSPFFIPMFIPDMSAGLISIRNKLMGPNYATVSACASSIHALMDAYMILKLGYADHMVCGGADATIVPVAIAGFNRARALSVRNDDPETASRPYDKDRDGFVMGEGGGALVLETYEVAKARGAKIHAEIAGVAASADAYHITAPHPEGEGVISVMESALKDAGIKPEDIDYINTHGTSTPLGDIAEVKAIKKVFGSSVQDMNLSSTKSMTGHMLGGAGIVETIACILSISHQIVPPTINVFNQDEEVDVNVTANNPKKREVICALNNGFGFGGHNGTVVLKKP